MVHRDQPIVIVGAGCFGLSTAYHLLRRGYVDVTVLDRSFNLPAPDAASNDLNRIVRSSYSDSFYSGLAREAILSWKDVEEWGDSYHESGVLVLGAPTAGKTYVDQSYANDVALGAVVQRLDNVDAIRSVFPVQTHTASFSGRTGFLSRDGGWANAGQGLSILLSKVVALGGKILPGKAVKNLIRKEGRTAGVLCEDDDAFEAMTVILATGSWTPSAFPELNLGCACLATGQSIAMVQLSDEEADKYRHCPVVLDFSSGFYIFPPNDKNVVKMATHSAGYTHTRGTVSTPRTISSNPVDGHCIPKASLQELRKHLRGVYPDLADKPFSNTRLCWYNDSPDGDWVIGQFPADSSLILATAGSGHAYKFLPVIGRLVADLVDNKLDPKVASKFAIDRVYLRPDTSRSGPAIELDLDQLCTQQDLEN